MNGSVSTVTEEESPWDEDEPSNRAADTEWDRLRDRYTNAGYREGIFAGKLSTVQAGFDAGYSAGAQAGRELGSLRGSAAYLLAKLLARNASGQLVDRCRDLVRDLGRLKVDDVLGPDIEALEHAREHGEIDVDELTGQLASMRSDQAPTLGNCKTRLQQLFEESRR